MKAVETITSMGAARFNREVREASLRKERQAEGKRIPRDSHGRQLGQDVQGPWGRWSSLGHLG